MAPAQALAVCLVYPGIPGYAGGYPGMYLLGREAIRDSRISGNSDIQIPPLRTLYVYNTSTTYAGRNALKAALPALTIHG